MSALEWWRATGNPKAPATHEEGEHLRCASGRSMLGGTNLFDVRKAIKVRYNGSTPEPVQGFARLWPRMLPGTVAVAQGNMGVFPTGSRWRRWSPNFAGDHAVCVYRLDTSDRVWWCDPNAPTSYRSGTETRTYDGEWMPKAEFKKYVDGFGGYHLIGTVVPSNVEEPDMGVTYNVLDWVSGAVVVTGDNHDLISLADNSRTPIAAGSRKGTGARIRLVSGAGRQDGLEAYMVNQSPEPSARCLLANDVTFEPAPVEELPPTVLVGTTVYRR